MARITFPEDFISQQTLFRSVKAKHDADGGSSPLGSYLLQNSISLENLATSQAEAAIHHTSSGLLSRQAENHKELRDNRFDPIFARVKKQIQFLKSYYKNNPRALGDWGITIDGKGRVVYPASFEEKLALVHTFSEKHDALTMGPGSSPLGTYLNTNGIDLAADNIIAGQAEESHKQFQAASRDSERETARRNHLHEPAIPVLRGIGGYLKHLHSDNAKSLGAYGYTVDDSPQAPKVRTTTLKAGESKTVNTVTIGGTFTNTGTGDLHLYRGKTTTGTPNIVPAGGQMGMLKGFSSITVVNPSTLTGGKFTVLTAQH